ncbi:hypothetical protein [Quatrionicoccus australiensis]|uniref:hypothetical protein n=1 Tax=Quatrionicoccus australiensis TaxID=138118 RepID=UPI001CF9342F|nr:hypothetical protein [Quatrionicoccus australiensis]MCB4359608.1 hypothetical protein [Quatrionicoccus australiensis]
MLITATLPFSDISDAHDNATSLRRAFEFYGITHPNGEPVTVPDAKQLIAELYAFADWQTLAATLDTGVPLQYYDGDGNSAEAHKALAAQLAPHLSAPDGATTIKTALLFAAFGCTPAARSQQQQLFGKMPRTIQQWHEIERLANGYAYATRYSRGRTAYEMEMLRHHHDVAVAKVLGTQAPKPPKKPKPRVRPAAAA